MDMILAFAPSLITHLQVIVLVIIGIILVLFGLGLFIIGFLKTPSQVTHPYYGIIPTLQKMDEYLGMLAKREARKNIDWDEYEKVNAKINKDILSLMPGNPQTITGAKRSMSKLEATVKQTYKDKVISIRSVIADVEPNSVFLDAKGFGLKKYRIKDRKYLRLSRELQNYRNLPIGTEVDDLIKLHIRVSECNANILLAIYRALRRRACVQGIDIGITDLISTNMQILLESAETNMNEETSAIRARIGECLNSKAEMERLDKRPKQIEG